MAAPVVLSLARIIPTHKLILVMLLEALEILSDRIIVLYNKPCQPTCLYFVYAGWRFRCFLHPVIYDLLCMFDVLHSCCPRVSLFREGTSYDVE
ncbi:hypothetical protein KPH14_003252 [Odynerus spinipes]|nr:hypothetical protein KPH14_003252 [Odynerus spinipes]